MPRAVLPLVLAACLASTPAFADSIEDAKRAFKSGAQAYREARYKDAIEQFVLANRLDPHPELVFNVGQAYEKLGDVPNALRSYRDYLRLSPSAPDRATVEASIRNLEARLRERGVQQVSVFSTPAGASVSLDGVFVGATPWTAEIAPGRHVLSLKANGYPETTKEIFLAADRAVDVDVTLAAAVGAPQTMPSTVSPPPEATSPSPPTSSAPIASDAPIAPRPVSSGALAPTSARSFPLAPRTVAALGAGVASFGIAVGFEVARKSAEDAARADATQIGYADKLDTMTSRQSFARAFAIAGGVATAAGIGLAVFDLRAKASDGAAPRTAIGCGPAGCSAFLTGRF